MFEAQASSFQYFFRYHEIGKFDIPRNIFYFRFVAKGPSFASLPNFLIIDATCGYGWCENK